PTTTAYQLWVASLAWFSEDYRAAFPGIAEAAAANTSAPANTHALFHTMAQIAAICSPYIEESVSLVSPDFDYTARRCYLNDHNEAVPYIRTGLGRQDLEVLGRNGVEL
ncbi:MAG: lipid A phosphoethanolamine transferase, partial [Alistipes sp.]|nr:lipid A phosphoethanolamine transferase [Alistipes sp.]